MKSLNEILVDVKTIAIVGHIRPDGDCIGSSLGLYQYLTDNYPQLELKVYLDSTSMAYDYLEQYSNISNDTSEDIIYDLCISLDTGDKERLGVLGKYFHTAKKTVCIDHHITNTNFAQTNYVVTDASSTSEVLFYLMELPLIGKETAACLYTGIISDTGVFKHSNTTESTMIAAAKLISKGIPFSKIIDDSFYRKTYIQNQILGRALLESITFFHGKCIFSALRQKELDFYGVTHLDLEGIVDQLRVTEGVECAIFLYETGIHEYKISMRSNNYIDVSKIAQYFGGGGHIRAAGCSMNGSIYDVINNLSTHIEKQMEQVKRE